MMKIEDFISKYGFIFERYNLSIYYINDPLYATNKIGICDTKSRSQSEIGLTNFQINKLSIEELFYNLIRDVNRNDAVLKIKQDILSENYYTYGSTLIKDPTRSWIYYPGLYAESKTKSFKLPSKTISDSIWYLNISKKVSGRLYYEYENSYIFKLLTNTNYRTLSKLDCEYLNIPYEDNLLITNKNISLY